MAHKNTSNVSPYTSKKKGPLRGRHKKPVKIFTHQEANDRLLDIFRNHGFDWVDHPTREQFVRFYRLLLKTQNKENFTRLLSIKDIGIKHFIDSMILAQITELQFPLLDMGTGPGFPGIPLRIITDSQDKIILSEGVQKRVAFLKTIREELKLENLDIIGRNVNSEFHYPVMGVVTRAVEDARNTLKNVMNCLQTGGRVYLMKGPNVGPEVKMALKDWGAYYKLVQDEAYTLPNTPHQRRLLVFEKIQHREANDENY